MQRRALRRAEPPPGAAARRGQPRLASATTSGPGPRGAALAPLPSLLVVVDEFSELLAGQAGVHRPVRRRSAASAARSGCTCCSPRSGSRRAGCAGWSRTCPTGSGCAPSPPASPGRCSASPTRTSCPAPRASGYLRPDPATMLRFQAAYVSGPPSAPRRRYAAPSAAARRASRPFTVSEVAGPSRRAGAAPVAAPRPRATSGRLLDVVVRPDGRPRPAGPPGVAAAARRARDPRRAAWPPGRGPAPGLVSRAGARLGGLVRPDRHRRPAVRAAPGPVALDLAGAGGHVGVVGGPRSGKSTLLRTLVAALALRHTPLEVQFYCLDFGGGASRAGAACRTSAGSARGPSPTSCAASSPRSRGSWTAARRLPRPRDRLDGDLSARAGPQGRVGRPVRRRLPRRRRLGHAARGVRGPRDRAQQLAARG